MRVAILMRTYNTDARLMELSIWSIIRQVHTEWRLFIWNDGGKTVSRVPDKRVTVVNAKENLGMSAVSDKLLAMVAEDKSIQAFTWLDSDGDQLSPRTLFMVEPWVDSLCRLYGSAWWLRVRDNAIAFTDRSLTQDLAASHNFYRGQVEESPEIRLVHARTLDPGLIGMKLGLFLPREVAEEGPKHHPNIVVGEDYYWTREVQRWFMETKGYGAGYGGAPGPWDRPTDRRIFDPVLFAGVPISLGPTAATFHIEGNSPEAYHRNSSGLTYGDVTDPYTSPFSASGMVARELEGT